MLQAEHFWDKTAESYAKSPIGDPEAFEYTLGRTRAYLKPADKVLELGCGTGSTALLLAGDVGQYIASDISGKMIEIAKRKAREQNVTNVEFVAANLFDKKLDQGPFDVVMALNLLHLIEDVAGALQRIHQLVKPGGIFVSKTVCQPDGGASLKFRAMKLVLPLMQFLRKAPFVRLMNADDFKALVEAHGFEILESGAHPAPSQYIVARRK